MNKYLTTTTIQSAAMIREIMEKKSGVKGEGPSISRPINYHLRIAKNIERKMMGEAFARLSLLAPLSKYRYVGFGSEFFNDFALYHQMLSISDMISIERDNHRIDRCKFNRPYGCINIIEGSAGEILPQLPWDKKSIVWLDYTEKLSAEILDDVSFLVSQACSGSVLIWSMNANPWDDRFDEATGGALSKPDLIQYRRRRLREQLSPLPVAEELVTHQLSDWGLAEVFYKLLKSKIESVLQDRNASASNNEKLVFEQIFNFRYADGVKMLTVGGVLLNSADRGKLGTAAFDGLAFIRNNEIPAKIQVPVLTSREVRHLSRRLPHSTDPLEPLSWLSQKDIEQFKEMYRYYPVFSESEL